MLMKLLKIEVGSGHFIESLSVHLSQLIKIHLSRSDLCQIRCHILGILKCCTSIALLDNQGSFYL